MKLKNVIWHFLRMHKYLLYVIYKIFLKSIASVVVDGFGLHILQDTDAAMEM